MSLLRRGSPRTKAVAGEGRRAGALRLQALPPRLCAPPCPPCRSSRGGGRLPGPLLGDARSPLRASGRTRRRRELMLYAAELGLDPRRFEEDLANDDHTWRIEEDRLGGERAGVRGTPTLFVNGVRYAGHMDLDGLLEAVEDASGSTGASLGEGGVAERIGPLAHLLDEVCSERRGVNNRTLRRVVNLAVEIAREGREGRKIGTLFVVGDSEAVLGHSRPMILDPLYGHPHESKRIEDPDLRETLKELAQLDGAFVVSYGGVVLSGARYIDAPSGHLELPLGLGSRHVAAASVSSRTEAVAVAVSESSTVRMFDDGELVAEIVPELWLLGGFGSYVDGSSMGRESRTTL